MERDYEDRKREKEREKDANALGGNGQRHVRYTRFTITRRGLSFAGYMRAFLSVCDLFLQPLPTNRSGRTYVCFGYLPVIFERRLLARLRA